MEQWRQFKSNLKSVPNTNALTAFGERLTTCFQQLWRHSDKNGQQNKIINRKSKSNEKRQGKEKRFLYKLILSRTSSLTRSAEHSSFFGAGGKDKIFKDLNTKFKKIFKRNQESSESKSRSSEQPTVQIIGKLFSSTLIAAATTTEGLSKGAGGGVGIQQQQRHLLHQQFSAIFSEIDTMTIAENTFVAVRYENPDIDNEIRAILTANAQNGSTIAEIKDEYRKQTGSSFPIYGNITDFLLSIPRVTAECNDNGTIFFNIKPSEKSKHIYDMVVAQNNRKLRSNSSSGSGNSNYVPNWGQKNLKPLQRLLTVEEPSKIIENRRVIHNNSNHVFFSNLNKNQSGNNSHFNGVLSMAMAAEGQQKQWKRPLTPGPRVDDSIQTPAIIEPSNWFFEDNLNYLNNRFKGAAFNGGNQMNYVAVPMAALSAQHSEHDFRIQPPVPPPQHRIVPTVETILGRPSAASSEVNSQQTANKDQYVTASSRVSSPHCSSQPTSNESLYTDSSSSDYNARILDFPLLGDDFFLYMARMELKCKFKKYEKVLQSGLCCSGQTINAALKRLRQMNPPQNTVIIVNIGSVDIMQGRPLIQIEHDFRQLINLMHNMCLTPVLTTLAPLANHAHDQNIKEKLLRFNEFIKREGQFLTVIDIHMSLVNEYGTLRFDCYQSQPRTVTGSKLAHVFWNKIGRQRVLQLIEANLEY